MENKKPGRRYHRRIVVKIGKWLLEDPKVKQSELARLLEVNARTLRNWKMKARKNYYPKTGRPSHDSKAHWKAMWSVGREMHCQGYPGWPSIAKKLEGSIPVRLIQLYVGRFRKKRKQRREQFIKMRRNAVNVLFVNAIWGQDAFHVGKVYGKKMESQIIKDRASIKTVGFTVGPPIKGSNVLFLLEKAEKIRGLPLVLMSDNGSPFCNDNVDSYLQDRKVIHLRSLPRTPQHNGGTEIHVRELEHGSGLGKGNVINNMKSVFSDLNQAIESIDKHRLRASKNFKTACELDENLPAVSETDRAVFFDLCSYRIKRAVQDKNNREACLTKRKVVFDTLEEFGYITQTRGSRLCA